MPAVLVATDSPDFVTARRPAQPQGVDLRHAVPAPLQSLVGSSPVMQQLRTRIEMVALRDARVLIIGPTGSGKELVARAIHRLSRRQRAPFIGVNCAALPRELVESELFGYERGAFTGAATRRRGLLELANGGTMFLDEIAELALDAQAKLLRVLENLRFRRVGGEEEVDVDVRVLAASNQDLGQRVRQGLFRDDLFHRLNVVTLRVPSLNEHWADVPELARHFLADLGAKDVRLSATAMNQLRRHSWPGNVRELRNTIERALVFEVGHEITAVDLPASDHGREHNDPPPSITAAMAGLSAALTAAISSGHTPRGFLATIEQTLAETALALASGNKTVAARWLEWDRKALTRRLRRAHSPSISPSAGCPGSSSSMKSDQRPPST